MKKYASAGILVIALIAIAALFTRSRSAKTNQGQQETEKITRLESELKELQAQLDSKNAEPTVLAQVETVQPAPEPVSPPEAKEKSVRRMMSSMAKMMENPTMNKVMEASQRGAIAALYSDFIEFLNLDADETRYFMDLLMSRQMKNVELGMKMMGGGLTEEEKSAMAEEIKQAGKALNTEMEKFLNSTDDFAEWEFYEKTMGERMMLSQMDQTLSGSEAALGDAAYKDLLGMMHDERSSYPFSSNLHDNENTDLSPERFSKENIAAHAADLHGLNEKMLTRAASILSTEQLNAFRDSLKATTEMQLAQLEMAAQMFGGK